MSTTRTSRRRAKRGICCLPESTVYVISFKSREKINRLKIRCQAVKNKTGVIRYTDKENRRTVNFASGSRG